MFDRQFDSYEAWVEGAYYAVQTVTTVGYGNWESPTVIMRYKPRPDLYALKVLHIKQLSILLMLIGATLYAVIIGVVANLASS